MKRYKQEIEKLMKLSLKEKIQYICDYYILWIIGFAVLIFVSGYLIMNYIHNNRDQHLYVAFVNTYANFDVNSDFYQEYAAYSNIDTNKETIIFDTQNYFDLTKGDSTGNYYYEKMVVLLDAGTADAVVMEKDNFEAMANRGRLMDLRHERTKHLLEKYDERMITISHTDETGETREIPVGIDLSDSKLVMEEQAYAGECVLGISAYAQHIDSVEVFLSYALGEE